MLPLANLLRNKKVKNKLKGENIMIEKATYDKLKEKYGFLSSWALWSLPTNSPKSNTSDLSIFNNNNLLSLLNSDYVFVGLNVSKNKDINENKYWWNFHSNSPHQNDFKLRYALMNTKFWGSYMTDIIKNHTEVNSKQVMAFLEQNPNIVEQNIKEFKEEICLLNNKTKPKLITMGNSVYKILSKYLSNEYTIVKIMHYSNYINQNEYKKRILETLKFI